MRLYINLPRLQQSRWRYWCIIMSYAIFDRYKNPNSKAKLLEGGKLRKYKNVDNRNKFQLLL